MATKSAPEVIAFDPTAPPPVNAQELLARLTKLQQNVAAADRERATAEARHEQAQKELAAIDEQLKKMGVDPATAEEALAKLEQELATGIAQHEQQVERERQEYAKILAATQ